MTPQPDTLAVFESLTSWTGLDTIIVLVSLVVIAIQAWRGRDGVGRVFYEVIFFGLVALADNGYFQQMAQRLHWDPGLCLVIFFVILGSTSVILALQLAVTFPLEIHRSVIYSAFCGLLMAVVVSFIVVRFVGGYRTGLNPLADQIQSSVLASKLDKILPVPVIETRE